MKILPMNLISALLAVVAIAPALLAQTKQDRFRKELALIPTAAGQQWGLRGRAQLEAQSNRGREKVNVEVQSRTAPAGATFQVLVVNGGNTISLGNLVLRPRNGQLVGKLERKNWNGGTLPPGVAPVASITDVRVVDPANPGAIYLSLTPTPPGGGGGATPPPGGGGGTTPPTAASFRPLGDVPGGMFHSFPTGVSDDGQVVVGFSFWDRSGVRDRAFRWTAAGGMQALPYLPNGDTSYAHDVSADGSVVVGAGTYGEPFRLQQAFRWTAAGGTVPLGFLPGATDQFRSSAEGVSPDGTVVVGYSVNEFGADQAYRWTAAGGMEGLPQLAGGQFSYATDVSADGNTVVGESTRVFSDDQFFFNHRHAFRWTPETGPIDLHPAEYEREGASIAHAVSPDGRHVAGELGIFAGLYWSPTQPTLLLPSLPVRPPAEPYSAAFGISADGGRIVGSTLIRETEKDGLPLHELGAVIWEADRKVQDLQKLLAQHNVNVGGWSLTGATAISADGRFIVGYGTNPQGQEEGWIVTLPR